MLFLIASLDPLPASFSTKLCDLSADSFVRFDVSSSSSELRPTPHALNDLLRALELVVRNEIFLKAEDLWLLAVFRTKSAGKLSLA